MTRATVAILTRKLTLLAILLVASQAQAQGGDLDAFSATGAPPNIALVMDSSGSMRSDPSTCSGSCNSKWEITVQAIEDLVLAVNPPDGSGGGSTGLRE